MNLKSRGFPPSRRSFLFMEGIFANSKIIRRKFFWPIVAVLSVVIGLESFRGRQRVKRPVPVLRTRTYVYPSPNDTHINTTTDDTTTTVDMFEWVREVLYREATTVTTIPTTSSERPKFTNETLRTWERGTGGLTDSDRLLVGRVYHDASSVFEYGLGESTKIAAYVRVPRYAGVDSDAAWVSQARDDALPHFRFTFADVGPTVQWGRPADPNLHKIHFDYQMAPLAVEAYPFDVYLVDGRYRIACACVSLLHALSRNADISRVKVGIHDSERSHYQYEFGTVADVVQRSDKLNLYQIKPGVTSRDIFDVWVRVSADANR